jgi:uncharacterized oligopeptide transporter (OPT) family protein
MYEGDHSQLEKKTYSINEIKNLPPEIQNELLKTNAGFGGEKIPAPQASLMAVVAKSIIGRKTEWILILIGILMGLAFILMQIKSPMLVAVGMYLPIETSFAIFVGGLFKAMVETAIEKRKLSAEKGDAVKNTGTLLSAGFISGEALIGILFAGLAFSEIHLPAVLNNPSYLLSILGIVFLGYTIVSACKKTSEQSSTNLTSG